MAVTSSMCRRRRPQTISCALLLLLLLLIVSCYDANANDLSMELSATTLNRTLAAAFLAQATGDPEDPAAYAEAYGQFEVYAAVPRYMDENIIDYTVVAKKDNVCYGAWRGTQLEWDDWFQNFDFLKVEVEGCWVHRGFDGAYSERDVVDAALSACLASCQNDTSNNTSSDGECELVLTGQSQGGASAVVAALYWRDHTPDVITFGAPRVVHGTCQSLRVENHYRFVNVDVSNGVMQYDTVPLVPTLGGTHFGQTFLLAEDARIAYIGLGEGNMGGVPNAEIHWITSIWNGSKNCGRPHRFPCSLLGGIMANPAVPKWSATRVAAMEKGLEGHFHLLPVRKKWNLAAGATKTATANLASVSS